MKIFLIGFFYRLTLHLIKHILFSIVESAISPQHIIVVVIFMAMKIYLEYEVAKWLMDEVRELANIIRELIHRPE